MGKMEKLRKLLTAVMIAAVLVCAGAVVAFAEEPEAGGEAANIEKTEVAAELDGGAAQNVEAPEADVEPAGGNEQNSEEVINSDVEAEVNGDGQALEEAISPAAEPQADGEVPDGNELTYESALSAIQSLETYASRYLNKTEGSTSVNRLVMNYIRSARYNGTQWNIVAGKVNNDFVNFVRTIVGTNVIQLQNVDNITLPDGSKTDFVHMFASMDAYANGFKNFGGWYGDLAQVMVEVAKEEGTKYDIRKAYEAAKAMINANNSLFNEYDVVADFQAYSVMKLLESNRKMKVSDAFAKINCDIKQSTSSPSNLTSLHVMSALFLDDCLGLSSDASFTKIASRLALVTVKDAVLVTALGVLEDEGPVRVSSAVRIGCRLAFAEFLYDNVNSYNGSIGVGNSDGAVQTNINEDNLEREIDAAIAQAEETLTEDAA